MHPITRSLVILLFIAALYWIAAPLVYRHAKQIVASGG